MPFKNIDQMRACFAQKAKGKKGWDCKKWAHKTPKANLKKRSKMRNFEEFMSERDPEAHDELYEEGKV